jgi:hypothetical protein
MCRLRSKTLPLVVLAAILLGVAASPSSISLRAEAPYFAAALRVQNTAADSDADIAVTLTGVQAGDLLTACIYERDGTTLSGVADSVNGSWTQVFNRATAVARIALFYFPNSGAGNPVVTGTIGGTSPRDINAAAWSGVATSPTVVSNTALNTGVTAQTHGSISPSGNVLVVTCMGSSDHGGMTPNAGFTALNVNGSANPNRQYYAYKVTHSGTIDVTHTSTNLASSEAGAGSFTEASGGGSIPCGLLLGVRRCE